MGDTLPMNQVYISLGSNIEAESNLVAAVALLQSHGTVTAASRVYETLPVKFHEQPNFLNAVVLFETVHDLDYVLDVIVPDVESRLKRVRDPANRNGPRTIDLDVVLFNDVVTRTERHQLPDPDIEVRAFVGIPLAEIAPDYVHPTLGVPLSDVACRFTIAPQDMLERTDVKLLPPREPCHGAVRS